MAAILIFIGAKFVLTEVVHIGVGVSLLVILVVMGTAIVASLRRTGRNSEQLARGAGAATDL